MATKKLSELSALAVLADADTFLANDASEAADADKPKYVTGTVLKTYTSGALTTAMALIDGLGFTPQFRLSLTSGNPINLADEAETSTVYYTPYGGTAIQLYNGSAWEVFTLSELSLVLTATVDKNYDIFIDYNAGTPQMVLGSAWTNDTTRADALAYQNGRLVKSGTAAYLYVGTIRANNTDKTINTDSLRYVYNYYNKIQRSSRVYGDSTKTIDFVLGIEETFTASLSGYLSSGAGAVAGAVGVNLLLSTVGSGDAWLTTEDDTNKIEVPFYIQFTTKFIGKAGLSWEVDSGSTAGMGTGATTYMRAILWS